MGKAKRAVFDRFFRFLIGMRRNRSILIRFDPRFDTLLGIDDIY